MSVDDQVLSRGRHPIRAAKLEPEAVRTRRHWIARVVSAVPVEAMGVGLVGAALQGLSARENADDLVLGVHQLDLHGVVPGEAEAGPGVPAGRTLEEDVAHHRPLLPEVLGEDDCPCGGGQQQRHHQYGDHDGRSTALAHRATGLVRWLRFPSRSCR